MRIGFLLIFLLTGIMTSAQDWEKFQWNDLKEEHRENGRSYLRFLDKSSLSMGLYVLEAGSEDPQEPHQLDEVYYVVEGTSKFQANNEVMDIEPGDLLFVKAQVPHRFLDISSDLKVLVIFSKTPFDPKDKDWAHYSINEVRKSADPEKNTWNEFLQVATLRWGLYMLPEKLGGDKTLTHDVDEINIVVRGTAQFRMGDEETEVNENTVVWVRSGIGHHFHSLSDDFEVLILFHVK